MQNETSDDLLVMISFGDEEPESRRAFAEFHRRFHNYVWEISYNAALSVDKHNAKPVASYLTQNTFIDVHKNASAFSKKTDNPDMDIKKWLSGFIWNKKQQYIEELAKRNKFLDYMDDLSIVDQVDRSASIQENEQEEVLDNYQKVLIDKALLQLRPVEKEILLAFFEYQDEGKVPPDIKKKIAKAYGVKPASLNQTKKRAYEKVEAYVNKALNAAHIKKFKHAKQR